MTLTAADVAEIMRLVEQSGFDEVHLEVEGVKLSLRRGGGAMSGTPTARDGSATGAAEGSNAPGVSISSDASRAGGASAAAGATGGTGASANTDPSVHQVESPLLGTFYRAPKPGAQPFVDIGSPVEENTVVAIIEVMKLMNTVRAGVRGTVTEILLDDGALAEFGQPLLRVRKAAG